MDEQTDLKLWLALERVPRLGTSLAKTLLEHITIDELFTVKDSVLKELGFSESQVSAITKPDWASIERALTWLDSTDKKIAPFTSRYYPKLLSEISSPPLLLYIQGDNQVLDRDQLAIVGTRSPTVTGKENAYLFARELCNSEVTVTSGLAIGIDGASHAAAVDAACPTVAVLGTGIDIVYPKRHSKLAANILNTGGVIVSEFAPGTPPVPHNFPRRNRIISGLCLGTLVVEAAIKSGSLITARFASEQNREVFAIPGSINNVQAKGCHYLIRQGAKLVEHVEHIFEELPNLNTKPINNLYRSAEKSEIKGLAEDQLLVSVDYEPTSVDSVVARSGLSVAAVLQKLLELELAGLVAAVPGGYIRLRGS
jgi:DNA processing protein